MTVVAATGLVDAVAVGLHLFRTATRNEPATRDQIGYFAASRVKITTDQPRKVTVDGEIVGETPLEVVWPRSLRLVAPPPAEPDAPGPDAKLDALPDVEIERV